MSLPRLLTALCGGLMLTSLAQTGDDIDRKYPLDPVLKVLADDVKNPSYRKIVLEKMIPTDLAAEWQRVETADNPDSFLAKHGGKEKVLADSDLKRAYERRVQIREDFLTLMRAGFQRHKQTPPFDKGKKAETAGTKLNKSELPRLALDCIPPSAEALQQWPGFRGPTGQGHAEQTDLPIEWDKDGRNIIWRVKVPGLGNSSPVVWNERIFLTNSDEKGEERALLCYRRVDGKLLWTAKAPPTPPEEVREKNGYASATPVTDGERVISFLGSCGIVCHDFDGKMLWHYPLPKIKMSHGTGASPVLYKDLVILLQDQDQSDTVFIALDKKTGKKVWQGKRSRGTTWATPVIVRVGERDELLIAGARTVKGYDPNNGKELWTMSGPTHEVIPMLVVGKDLVYSCSGRNGPTIALRPGGEGDISKTGLVWRATRSGPHVPSPILVGDLLYTFNDTGVATCLDAETGELIWQERLDDCFSASPLAAGDRIYVPGESGVTHVLRAGRKLEILAKNDMEAPILASLAAVDQQLVLRTQAELVLIGKK